MPFHYVHLEPQLQAHTNILLEAKARLGMAHSDNRAVYLPLTEIAWGTSSGKQGL